MDTLELLYDHYKESISHMKMAQRERDKIFIVLCILLAALYFFGVNPSESTSALQQILDSQFGIKTTFEFSILQALLWILLLYFTLRYLQRNIYSERLTNYIHSLEKEISSYAQLRFDRESTNYLNEYPLVLDLIHWIYTFIFPIAYLSLIIFKIRCEGHDCLVFDKIIAFVDSVLILAYLCFLHKSKFMRILHAIRKITHL